MLCHFVKHLTVARGSEYLNPRLTSNRATRIMNYLVKGYSVTDWIVWPLFVAQFFIFLLFFVHSYRRFFGITIHVWIMVFMLLVNALVLISLIHDSTSVIGLHF